MDVSFRQECFVHLSYNMLLNFKDMLAFNNCYWNAKMFINNSQITWSKIIILVDGYERLLLYTCYSSIPVIPLPVYLGTVSLSVDLRPCKHTGLQYWWHSNLLMYNTPTWRQNHNGCRTRVHLQWPKKGTPSDSSVLFIGCPSSLALQYSFAYLKDSNDVISTLFKYYTIAIHHRYKNDTECLHCVRSLTFQWQWPFISRTLQQRELAKTCQKGPK